MQYHYPKINMREFKMETSNLKSKYKSKVFFISLKEDKVICGELLLYASHKVEHLALKI